MILKKNNLKASNGVKIALVHDFLIQFGGAERVLLALHRIFPDAPIYALLSDKKISSHFFSACNIRESFLGKLPEFLKKRHRIFLPLFPLAIESFDLSDFDIIISSSSAFAKGVVTRSKAVHICYCHSPARFLWDYHCQYQEDNRFGILAKMIARFFTHRLRIWDRASAERVDFWIANSETTKKRIEKYYRKSAEVIYPPLTNLTTEQSNHLEAGFPNDYFLVVSRLSAYKKIDVIISAFNKLKLPLLIVGDGPERKKLEAMAGDNIKFAGFVSDEKLFAYYQNAKAFVLANEEDFGLSALEAASFGKPVLAYKKGGALEWMEEGKTGEFFDTQTPEVLADGVRRILFNIKKYDQNHIKAKASKFNEERFKREILNFLKSKDLTFTPENV